MITKKAQGFIDELNALQKKYDMYLLYQDDVYVETGYSLNERGHMYYKEDKELFDHDSSDYWGLV